MRSIQIRTLVARRTLPDHDEGGVRRRATLRAEVDAGLQNKSWATSWKERVLSRGEFSQSGPVTHDLRSILTLQGRRDTAEALQAAAVFLGLDRHLSARGLPVRARQILVTSNTERVERGVTAFGISRSEYSSSRSTGRNEGTGASTTQWRGMILRGYAS